MARGWFGETNEPPSVLRIILLWPPFLILSGIVLLCELLREDWHCWRHRG